MHWFTVEDRAVAVSRVRGIGEMPAHHDSRRVRADGKFFRLGSDRWALKGLTYGPFAPNRRGLYVPERARLLADLRHMRELGATALRLYHLPDEQFLDDALAADLRVMIDVPWEKHRCFFEDWYAQEDAIARVRETAHSLGRHPAVFAISIANEIPKDVVRFYGGRRVEQFVERLIDTAREEAPDCLLTYTNYPSTEFLTIRNQDFCCFNVYLEDRQVLGRYLNHLQHVAGSLPLILGEHGVDSIRQDEQSQASSLSEHLHEVARRGLAGSFVFSYTDDWFTGGHQITDWAFGVTDVNRNEKPAAESLRSIWKRSVPSAAATPTVSVVVCSYNGASTLRACLRSLAQLEYPDYEVILVDDGSTDGTAAIAAEYPDVRYVRQENRGLSVARNVGAELARGEVVAYTDSDCVVDEAWLTYLMQAMHDQNVDAIGGPNLPPPSDSWTAKCVAASPGGPSHVMLDDHRAEHVPGCNMAFRRSKLLELGGFDAQFRQAGDDVDICWRFLDAGMEIGYSGAALVWHHRRNTVRAYLKQQKGYGRSEAMLHFKHPERFNRLGCSRWNGIIYGEGAVGLEVSTPAVYHGRFGSGLFQIVYRSNDYTFWSYLTLLEWYVLILAIAPLAVLNVAVLWICAAMVGLSLAAALRSTMRAPLPHSAPMWCRPVVFALYLLQPVVRAWHRYAWWFRGKRCPTLRGALRKRVRLFAKRIASDTRDLYWLSNENRGREAFLETLIQQAEAIGWKGNFHCEWHKVRIHTATEELGWPKRFTRVRCSLRPTVLACTLCLAGTIWTITAVMAGQPWAMLTLAAAWTGLLLASARSRRRCLRSALQLVWHAGLTADLDPVASPRRRAVTRRVRRKRITNAEVSDAEFCFE